MYLTRFEQWHDETGKPFPTEDIRVEFFESNQQAIESFEKAIHQDMWIAPDYPTGTKVVDTNRNETKVFWVRGQNEITLCVTTYRLTENHPMTQDKGF